MLVGLERPKLVQNLAVAGPVLVAAVIAAQVLSGGAFALGVEAAFLRAAAALRSENGWPLSTRVVLVTIEEDDFRDPGRFNGATPLAPGPLSELLDAVALGRPAIVAVALDTSARAYRTLTPPPSTEMIWGQEAEPIGRDKHRLFGVLGRSIDETPPVAGVQAQVREVDGLVWRSKRRYEGLSRDALGWIVLKAYCVGRESSDCRARNIDSRRDLLLDFAGGRSRFARFTSGQVLRSAQTPEWHEDGPLHRKIVIVGSRYGTAHDEVMTPVGPVSGTELLALAIETDLKGGGLHPVPRDAVVFAEVAAGLVMILLFQYVSLEWATGLALLALPLGCGLAWFSAYPWTGGFAGVVWVALCLGILELYLQARQYRRRAWQLSGIFKRR